MKAKRARPEEFILRFCHDIVGLDSLHFGLWDNGEARTIDGLKAAQENYSRFLIARIPSGVISVLDVGCGSGELSDRLAEAGYDVTALTPDSYFADRVMKRLGSRSTFALSKFEEFETSKKYDLIILSESCQYMIHRLFFPKARALLADGGHLLISDYFRKADTPYYKTVWTESEFSEELVKSKFQIVWSDDITEKTLPTLDVAKKCYAEIMLPTIELERDLLVQAVPALIVRIVRFFLRKQEALATEFLYTKQFEQFDSARFKEHLSYRVILLKKG